MREFVFGTAEQFNALDRDLSAGKMYKFENRQLPDCCSPATATVWFAKLNGEYHIYIDKGISANTDHQGFKGFLERGVVRLRSMEEVILFCRSLQPLYREAAGECGNAAEQTSPTSVSTAAVVDKQRLREITAAECEPRVVWPEELAAPIKKKVFGQDEVIDALADKIVISQMRKNRKLLVIALVGPTATGKSETAKTLAEVMSDLYGVQYGYIEIAGSEFIGEHTVHRFFGAPPGYVGHGQPTILEPVRSNPHHIIVINEIEKADEKILVGLMEAIDTGKIGMADNSGAIDLNHCVLLFTSNIPINMEEYAACTEFEKAEICRDAFTKHCGRPEISGKIGNFLVFNRLSDDAVTDIIIKFVREELDSYDLKLAHIDEYLMADFLKHQTKYGARGIRGLVSDSVGRHLLRTRNWENYRNNEVSMHGTIDHIEFELETKEENNE